MKIEIWSDFVCPFCYLGKRRLEKALESFPNKDKVEIIFKSFELDPKSKRDTTFSIHEVLAKKYGMSLEQAKKANENIGQQAEAVGLDFKFDTMIPTNTFDAHRLAKFAETKGKGTEMIESLLRAYFTKSKHIGDLETLVNIAEEIGLERQEVKLVLEGKKFTEEVRSDESEAREIGIQGVPFFVLNSKYAISGAQPIDVFINALEKALEDDDPLQQIRPSLGETCTDEGCEK